MESADLLCSYIRDLSFTGSVDVRQQANKISRAMGRCEGHNTYLSVLRNRRLHYSNAKQARRAMGAVN